MVLWLVIIRIAPGKKEAEDILEQTYFKAWNSFDLYIPQNETLLRWMISVARNLAKGTVNGKIVSINTQSKTLKKVSQ